jgi:hypothetical protein
MASIVQWNIEQSTSLCPHYVYLLRWPMRERGSFLLTNTVSRLCCDARRGMRVKRGATYVQAPVEGGGTHTRRHFVICPHLQTDVLFSLFSKIVQHLANLLLHILLHLLTYDAVQTVRPLTAYSTKNSNSGILNLQR